MPCGATLLKKSTWPSTSFAADDSLRVFVLAAEGSVFCAGMDLGEMQERAQSKDGKQEWQRDSEVYADVLEKIYSS